VGLTLLLVGLVVGANNLAVSLTLGSLGQAGRRWRIVPMFGLTEFTIPLVGLWVGRQTAQALAGVMGWLPTALLAGLGVVTLVASVRGSVDEEALARQVTSWRGLTLLAIALGVDNLLIGFGLGARDLPAVTVAATISLCSMAFSWAGLHTGALVTKRWQSVAKAGSGVLLIVLAAYLHFWS